MSTATEVGPVATPHGAAEVPIEPVQSDGVRMLSDGVARLPKLTSVMSLVPRLATTATPVAVLIATAEGTGVLPAAPTVTTPTTPLGGGPTCVGTAVGCTARFATAIDPFGEPVPQTGVPLGGQETVFTTVMG